MERPRPEKRKEQPQNSFTPERETEQGEGSGTMPFKLQVQSLKLCVCLCGEHFLFCDNLADLLSFLRSKFNSQLINMWPFGAAVCAARCHEWSNDTGRLCRHRLTHSVNSIFTCMEHRAMVNTSE